MPLAQITGSALHYVDLPGTKSGTESGKKTPVLFLHAFPLSHEMWQAQLEVVTARGHRAIAFDARGFGKSRPVPHTTAMSLIADDAASLLRHLEIDKAIVAGLSMGGYAAFEFVRRHASLLDGLVLADTRATADTFEGKQGREAFAKNAVEKGIDWVATEMPAKLLRPDPDPAVDANVRRIIRSGTPEGVAAAQRGMAARADSSDLLPKISVRTLVIVGELDGLTPPADAEAMAREIRGATLVRVPRAGHLSNLENPAAFNEALTAFLS